MDSAPPRGADGARRRPRSIPRRGRISRSAAGATPRPHPAAEELCGQHDAPRRDRATRGVPPRRPSVASARAPVGPRRALLDHQVPRHASLAAPTRTRRGSARCGRSSPRRPSSPTRGRCSSRRTARRHGRPYRRRWSGDRRRSGSSPRRGLAYSALSIATSDRRSKRRTGPHAATTVTPPTSSATIAYVAGERGVTSKRNCASTTAPA